MFKFFYRVLFLFVDCYVLLVFRGGLVKFLLKGVVVGVMIFV